MDLMCGLCYIIHVADNGVWLSLVERFVRDEEVARSNRVTPTIHEAVNFNSMKSTVFSYRLILILAIYTPASINATPMI